MANYAGALVNGGMPILAIPFLIHSLGTEVWGLVAFVNLMVVLMTMLNTGVAQAMVREFGMRWADPQDGPQRTALLMRGYERIYWIIAIAVAGVLLPFSGAIARLWLNTNAEIAHLAVLASATAITIFVAVLPSSVYRGTLQALQEHVSLNVIRSVSTVLKFGVGVLVVIYTGSVISYMIVLVIASYAECLALGITAWRFMPKKRREVPCDFHETRLSARYSITMSLVVVIGVAALQLDRFLVSFMLSIEQLGIYSVAVSLSLGILQLSFPLFTSVLPRLVELERDRSERRKANMVLVALVFGTVVVAASVYMAVGQRLLELWLADPVLAQKVAAPLDWLLVGAALNMLYNIGYTNWVSLGRVRAVAIVNITSLIVSAIVTPAAIGVWGITGAASSLVIINAIGATYAVLWLALAPKPELETQNP